jgi:cell wall-associated NlpC family hydrolase
MKLLVLVSLSLVFFSACSTRTLPHSKLEPILEPLEKLERNKQPSYELKSDSPIALALYDEYKKWDDTPYCYGGTSKDGVDCSSLVQTIYLGAFGVRLPRTTQEQAKVGYEVARNETKEGDIVFFKTGYETRHSGIYLEYGNFINTSTSRGVTISNLNNPYWKNAYWQSRRILDY